MVTNRNVYKRGHLTARPGAVPANGGAVTGLHPLHLGGEKNGLFYIPSGYSPERPAALAVMLHGAGGNADHGLSLLRTYADEQNMMLLAPVSAAGTWDIIAREGFGPDVIFLDEALSFLFGRYAVNPEQLAIGGFSDGASYALCIGLSNGHLFSHIIAFSPGFAYASNPRGKPAVFISHGTDDTVLPIGPCSRRLVPLLREGGYQVLYEEFEGGHYIPPAVSDSAVKWLTAGAQPA